MNIQKNTESVTSQQNDTNAASPQQSAANENNVPVAETSGDQQSDNAPTQPGAETPVATETPAGQPGITPGSGVAPASTDNDDQPPQPPAGNSTDAVTPPQPPESTPSFRGSTSEDSNTKAYLVKYLLSLIMTGTLIGLVISFFTSIVDSIGTQSAGNGWLAQVAYQTSLAELSTAIVFVAALWLIARQCYATENAVPGVKKHRWRKGFLGVFLLLLGLSALCASVALVYDIVSLIVNIGVVSADGLEVAKSIINSAFSAFLLTVTAILYAQDYTSGKLSGLMRDIHHYGLLISVVVLAVLFAVMPLRMERDSFIDGIASEDIETLQDQIDDYAREHNELPGELSDLELDDGLEKRLDDYEYTANTASYEICTEFRTDTTEEESSGNPFEDALTSSGLSTSSTSRENDPAYHEEGRECFEYEALGVSSFESPSIFERQQPSRQNDQFRTPEQTN